MKSYDIPIMSLGSNFLAFRTNLLQLMLEFKQIVATEDMLLSYPKNANPYRCQVNEYSYDALHSYGV